jgi:hypothetical protein
MDRRLLALPIALLVGVLGYIALDHLYSISIPDIDVSDGHDHGPDYGSPEWQGTADHAFHFRAMLGGAATGLLTFAAVFCLGRRFHDKPVI